MDDAFFPSGNRADIFNVRLIHITTMAYKNKYQCAWARQKARMEQDPEYAQREKDRKVAYLKTRYHTDEEFWNKMHERMGEYMRARRSKASEASTS